LADFHDLSAWEHIGLRLEIQHPQSCAAWEEGHTGQ
jgi:hypothetical protein